MTDQARVTLQEVVYRNLKDKITSGAYSEGQLITVKELVEETNTSAMPVREAIRRLVSEHGLQALANGKIVVPDRSIRERAIAHASRLYHETMAIRLAASKVDRAAISELEAFNSKYEDALSRNDIESALRSNRDFHFFLYSLSNSNMLCSMIEAHWLANGPYVAKYLRSLPSLSQVEGPHFHRKIIDNLAEGNAEGAAASLRDDLHALSELEAEMLALGLS